MKKNNLYDTIISKSQIFHLCHYNCRGAICTQIISKNSIRHDYIEIRKCRNFPIVI